MTLKNKTILSLLFAITCITLISCSKDDRIRPNGEIKTEGRILPGFTGISAINGMSISLSKSSDNNNQVILEGDSNILPYIGTVIQNNILYIYFKDVNIKGDYTLKINVNYNTLNLLHASGGSNFTFKSPITIPDMLIKLQGGSNVKMYGAVDDLNLSECSGGSSLDAIDLVCKRLSADLSGRSKLSISIAEKYNIYASGGSEIIYRGDATGNAYLSGESTLKKQY